MAATTTAATILGRAKEQESDDSVKRHSRMKEQLLQLLEMQGELEDRQDDALWMAIYVPCQRRKLIKVLDECEALEWHIREGLYGSGTKQNGPGGGRPSGECDNAA